MYQEAFRHEQQGGGQSPRNAPVFDVDALANYACISSVHQQQFDMPHPTGFDPISYQLQTSAPHQIILSSTAPLHSQFNFGAATHYYQESSSPTISDYQCGTSWCGQQSSCSEASSQIAPSSSYDPRDLVLTPARHAISSDASAFDHCSNEINSFASAVTNSCDGLPMASKGDKSFDEVSTVDDYGIKSEFSSDDSSAKHSDDEEIDEALEMYDTVDDRILDEPYAKLIYRALKAAPGYSMALQDIYQWFQKNTDKVKPGQIGWRNSIRHNLSMNAAFNKLYPKTTGEDSRKNSTWVLDRAAINAGGVAPTTRYRKSIKKCLKPQTSNRHRRMTGSCMNRQLSSSNDRSKPRFKQEDSGHTPSLYACQEYSQQLLGESRHSSSLPDSRHLSPSTPTGLDFVPTAAPFIHKPTAFVEHSSNDSFAHSFPGLQGLYLDSAAPILCGDDLDMQQQWSGVYDY